MNKIINFFISKIKKNNIKKYDQSEINIFEISNRDKLKLNNLLNLNICNKLVIKKIIKYSGIDKIGDDYDHYFREKKSLSLLKNYKQFPKIIYYNDELKELCISYCGEPINKNNIPKDWKKQILNIYKILNDNRIYHNDFWINNLTVKNEIIYLIDFGWSTRDYPEYPYLNILREKKILNKFDDLIEYLDYCFENAVKKRLSKFPEMKLVYKRLDKIKEYN